LGRLILGYRPTIRTNYLARLASVFLSLSIDVMARFANRLQIASIPELHFVAFVLIEVMHNGRRLH
jgi:hypothetical protein